MLISRTILPSYVVIPHEDITQYYFICCQSATFSFESKIHLRRHSDFNIRFINVYQYALRSFATSDRRLANLRVPAVQANFVRPFVLVDAFEHLHVQALGARKRMGCDAQPLQPRICRIYFALLASNGSFIENEFWFFQFQMSPERRFRK